MEDACFILNEYLSILDKYTKIYGDKTIVLYQNGTFFEFYGVDNNIEKLGKAKEVSNMTGLQLARRNNMIPENNRKNFLQVGFPIYQIEKYIQILVEEYKYTCVIVEQDNTETKPKTKERKKRSVTGIVGPSTNVKYILKPTNNYLICFYIEKEKPSKLSLTPHLTPHLPNSLYLTISMSAIDISTGELICYECNNSLNDENIVYDETNRILNALNPSEIILYIDDDIREHFLSQILIQENVVVHNYNMNNIVLKDYNKSSFQNQYLSKIYKKCGLLTPIEYIELEKSPSTIISLILLIDYCYNQNENCINNIEPPQIWNKTNYLILDNTTLTQLNIIEKDINCVYKIVDKTSTPLGKRLLKKRLSLPYIDVKKINESYDLIDDMLTSQLYESCETILKNIIDIERLHRKISIKIITPEEFFVLKNNYKYVLSLITLVKDIKHGFSLDELLNIEKYINNILNLISKDSINIYSNNIFNKGYDNELDLLDLLISNETIELNKLINNMCNVLKNDDYITLKQDKESNISYISCTPTRWNTFINKCKQENIQFKLSNDIINYNEWIKSPLREIKDDVKMTCNTLQLFTSNLEKTKSTLYKRNIDLFNSFIESLYEKHEYIMFLICQFISIIDFSKSCAKCAVLYNYCKPIIENPLSHSPSHPLSHSPSHPPSHPLSHSHPLSSSPPSYVKATQLRHALIERLNTKINYVAQDVNLLDNKNMLLFGVNCSGKSSYMKSVGVSVIMAQAGMYVPAKRFVYYPYFSIMTRIIGNDDIIHGKSTFAVEMSELRSILRRTNENCLILGDEVCHGTETISAVSILSATLVKLAESNCSSIFTTHYHQVTDIKKIKELEKEGKLSMFHFKIKVIDGTIIYDRNLESGSGSSLYGLEIAKSMNFNNDFIQLANEIRKEILNVNPILTSHRSNYNKDLYVDLCQICGEKAVDTHHIKYQCNADENNFIDHVHKNHLSNLVCLCKKCHQNVHSSSPTIKINGYVQSSNGIYLDYITF